MSDRDAFREARDAGLAARQAKRLEAATYTAAEVKVLTEAALRLGRKEAGEDIARTADEIAEGCASAAKVHRQASIDATSAGKRRSHMQTALAFKNQAAGAWAVRDFARNYPYETLQDASDATSGVPRHSEVSEAARSPQEPCGHPDCLCADMHSHPDSEATK